MALIVKGEKKLFLRKKRNRLLITKEILKKTTNEEQTIINLNIDTAFEVAWAEFMRMGELTYMAAEVKKAIFSKTGLTRLDILFGEDDQYVVLRLKQSKTDTEHTRV